MSLIREYRATEDSIKELQAQLSKLSENSALQKEMEFEEKLRQLMGEYQKSLREIRIILDPQGYPMQPRNSGTQPKPRRARVAKVYFNPHTGEQIETKGGNHTQLKQWKEEHGADEVESWLQ